MRGQEERVGKTALGKLLRKIRPLREGDQVEFLEDVTFYNIIGNKIMVKRGTRAYIFLKDHHVLVLQVNEKKYRGLSFALSRENWDKVILVRGGEQ